MFSYFLYFFVQKIKILNEEGEKKYAKKSLKRKKRFFCFSNTVRQKLTKWVLDNFYDIFANNIGIKNHSLLANMSLSIYFYHFNRFLTIIWHY